TPGTDPGRPWRRTPLLRRGRPVQFAGRGLDDVCLSGLTSRHDGHSARRAPETRGTAGISGPRRRATDRRLRTHVGGVRLPVGVDLLQRRRPIRRDRRRGRLLGSAVVTTVRPPSTRVEAAVAAIAAGGFVVVVDDEDRENEGDLIMAAERVTPEAIAFMVRHTSGLVCVGMTGERLDELDIGLMVERGTEALGTAFTVSVDVREGTTTGISAADRAATIRALVDPASAPADFARPGHVFPLPARPGGVLRRPGHTEAAVDLATLAGLSPAGVLCELVRPDGAMARGDDLAAFAAEHGLPLITIDELIAHRRRREQLVLRRSSSILPTPYGPFTVHAFESL